MMYNLALEKMIKYWLNNRQETAGGNKNQMDINRKSIAQDGREKVVKVLKENIKKQTVKLHSDNIITGYFKILGHLLVREAISYL